MNEKEIKRITKMPEHVFPNKEQMIHYILEFKVDSGAQQQHTFTHTPDEVIKEFQIAKEYFEVKYDIGEGRAKGQYLNASDTKLPRFED